MDASQCKVVRGAGNTEELSASPVHGKRRNGGETSHYRLNPSGNVTCITKIVKTFSIMQFYASTAMNWRLQQRKKARHKAWP
jgi:hypothetical protein